MAAEMEANRDSICNFTFLLNPTLTYDIFVYYALEHIDNTSIHTIIIYFIPYIDGPLGKWIPSNIQSILIFHQRVSNTIKSYYIWHYSHSQQQYVYDKKYTLN